MTGEEVHEIINSISHFIDKKVLVTSFFPDGKFFKDEVHKIRDIRPIIEDRQLVVFVEYYSDDKGASGHYIHSVVECGEKQFVSIQREWSVVFEVL